MAAISTSIGEAKVAVYDLPLYHYHIKSVEIKNPVHTGSMCVADAQVAILTSVVLDTGQSTAWI